MLKPKWLREEFDGQDECALRRAQLTFISGWRRVNFNLIHLPKNAAKIHAVRYVAEIGLLSF